MQTVLVLLGIVDGRFSHGVLDIIFILYGIELILLRGAAREGQRLIQAVRRQRNCSVLAVSA